MGGAAVLCMLTCASMIHQRSCFCFPLMHAGCLVLESDFHKVNNNLHDTTNESPFPFPSLARSLCWSRTRRLLPCWTTACALHWSRRGSRTSGSCCWPR